MSVGIMASARRVGTTPVFSDDFNRANNATTLGAEWLHQSGEWRISSNQALRAGSSNDNTVFLHNCGEDHWAEATMVFGSADGRFNCVNARRRSDNDQMGYLAFVSPSGGVGLVLGSTLGGYHDLVTDSSVPTTTPHTLRIEVNGWNPATIKVYHNGVLKITTTNSEMADPGFITAQHFYTGLNATDQCLVDNFRCGPLPYTP